MTNPTRYRLCAALTLCISCADDLAPDDTGADAGSHSTESVTSTDNGDGTTTTIVDGSDAEAWTYFVFTSGGEAMPAAPEASDQWDLGVQRFKIKLNGGISGGGDAALSRVAESFDDMTAAPADGYATDAADSLDDEDMDPDLAFLTIDGGWYDYDPATHVITPKDAVYVVRAASGAHYKVQLLDYYDAAGTPGFVTYRWAPIASP